MATDAADDLGSPRRKRRPPGEARRLLVDAAQRCFKSQGYGNTSTRDIAEEADVSEGLLFRYFGTKKQLFNEAMVTPFAMQTAEYVSRFDPRLPAQGFQEGLFELLDRNRELLMAVLSAEVFESEVVDSSTESPLAPIVRNLEALLDADVDLYGFANIDAYTTARLCFAMNLGLTFFDQWLFDEPERRPDRATLIRAMLVQIVHGLAHRPAPAGESGSTAGGGPARDR
ncbi:MAG: TetR family transcriptional regulator [Acidimicrobiia bacterium]|nr:TetR family transcriptional regulator [Acidimicrobiia bacterium]